MARLHYLMSHVDVRMPGRRECTIHKANLAAEGGCGIPIIFITLTKDKESPGEHASRFAVAVPGKPSATSSYFQPIRSTLRPDKAVTEQM